MILNGFFFLKSFFKIGMWHSRPPRDPPSLHGKYHLKFPFWLLAPFPKWSLQIVHLELFLKNCLRMFCVELEEKSEPPVPGWEFLWQSDSYKFFLFRFLSSRFSAASPSLAINVSRSKKSYLLWRLDLKYFLISSGCTREYWQKRPLPLVRGILR